MRKIIPVILCLLSWSSFSDNTSLVATKKYVESAAIEIVESYLDYKLTNLVDAAFVVSSGVIANHVATGNISLRLNFSSDDTSSGDCLVYVENNDVEEHAVFPSPNTYNYVSTDLAKALTLGAGTTNVLCFSRVKKNTVLVSKVEVK